ncbi:tetratricopeptide repeat protein [Gordonia alkaliphila]|uniref:Tetratricopeptide repeat protein n=1 Tax=Gordonia alkaliphila TaxID=1053547 RepID=A0ABP8YXI6_9ACTN
MDSVGDVAGALAEARVADDPIRTSANIDAIAARLTRSDMDRLALLLRTDPALRHAGADVSAAWFVAHQPPADGQPRWDDYLSTWLTALRDDDNDAFEMASSSITWQLRSHRPDVLNALALSQVIAEQESSSDLFDTHLSILLQAARYDFNFERIERILSAVGEGVTNSSLYYRAMLQYSRLGRGKQVTVQEISTIATATDSEKILSLLLHGLWFTADQRFAEEMLSISRRLLVINPQNAVTYMRQASALRRVGRFPEAVTSINKAIALNPPTDREVHNDFKLERVTIAIQHDAQLRLERETAAQLERQGRVQRRKLNALIDRTNDQLSDSLFKVVEILGVFTAIIGAIATIVAGNAIGDGISWWARILLVLAGGVVILGFFVLLRFIVRPPPPLSDEDLDDFDDDEDSPLLHQGAAGV